MRHDEIRPLYTHSHHRAIVIVSCSSQEKGSVCGEGVASVEFQVCLADEQGICAEKRAEVREEVARLSAAGSEDRSERSSMTGIRWSENVGESEGRIGGQSGWI